MTTIIRRKRDGEAWETAVDEGGSGPDADCCLSTPDADGAVDPCTILPGDSLNEAGGGITIQPGSGGDGDGALAINDGQGNAVYEVTGSGQASIGAGGGAVDVGSGGGNVIVAAESAALGFYGGAQVTQPVVPLNPTAQDVVDALVALNLVSQPQL